MAMYRCTLCKSGQREKRRLKKNILICVVMFVLIGLLPGCGEEIDYTDYFSVSDIKPIDDDEENMLEVDYEINNLGKKNDVIFCVTINGVTEEYSIGAGSQKKDKIVIDIERPETYVLEYPVTYEVKKEGKSIWSKEDVINYDCTDMFIHDATITYGSESVKVQVVDYQSNYYDLSEMFPGFDANAAHNVIIENGENDIGRIEKDKNSENGKDSAAVGSVLRLSTYGNEKLNDTYHFKNDLIVKIEEATSAASVNWNDYLTFTDQVGYANDTVAGVNVSTMTFYVNIENPSDEDIYGSLVKFYVNDSAIADEYMSAASSHTLIRAYSKDEVHYVTSGPVMRTTGVTDVQRLGAEVVLEDEEGNVFYDDVLWLELE